MLVAATTLVVAIWSRRDSTIYAPGYSWSKYSSIRKGMTTEEVTGILGKPLSIERFDGEIHWDYNGPEGMPAEHAVGRPVPEPGSEGASFVADLSGKVIEADHGIKSEEARKLIGGPLEEVRKRYGEPPSVYTIPWQTNYWYSRMRNVEGEYVMLIHFDEAGRVYQIDAQRIGG